MAVKGYAGKILRVDLTNERISEEVLSEAELRKWVGGSGIGAKYLYDEVPPGVEWNSPENRLIVSSGPLSGTRMPGGTISIVTKGPLTNGAVATQANGFMGTFMKFSGYDAVIFQGAAKRWLYLYMHGGKAELRDAQYLVGKNTWETEDAIKKELGYGEKAMSVFCVGPAGENLVKFAGIFGDKDHVAGHNGTGAVMGSKKLKAFCAARGTNRFPVADPDKLGACAEANWERTHGNPVWEVVFNWGTGGNLARGEGRLKGGNLPIKNYLTSVDYPNPHLVTTEYSRKLFPGKPNPCWGCRTTHCHLVTFTEGKYKGLTVEEPEYEMYAGCGPLIGCSDAAEIHVLANLYTLLGLEGNEGCFLVSMAIELYEKGLLKKEDTGGLELTWGNTEAVKTLLTRVAHREGAFANILAEGVARAAESLGPAAKEAGIYVMKGSSPRMHDHRAMWKMMFDAATADTSTDESGYSGPPDPHQHVMKDGFSPEQVSTNTAKSKGYRQFGDSLILCTHAYHGTTQDSVDCLNAATGWDYTPEEANRTGFRIANVFRAFNIRHGMNAVDLERPSPRYGSTPTDGPAKGKSIQPYWNEMLDNYYNQMGWDKKTGKPKPETLKSLGLDYIVKDLWK